MSFSKDVKKELSKNIPKGRHCQIAEIGAIFAFCGRIKRTEEGSIYLYFSAENESVVRKCFTLLKKTFRIEKEFAVEQCLYRKKNKFILEVRNEKDAVRILQAIKYLAQDKIPIPFEGLINPRVIQNHCCRRAFLRGAFLCAGSISDPEKFYHFEIVCTTLEKAKQLQELIGSFEIYAKIVNRKNHEVVYVKEGEQIVELLGLMGANISLMNLENIRILKDMRNSINRKVNCDAANINKTVNAALKQVQDIEHIRDTVGISSLPENLEAVARLRLEYPEASLKELGEMLSPKIGKSGVNHRLRKIGSIAEELKGFKEERI